MRLRYLFWGLILVLSMSSVAMASTMDITITAEGDGVRNGNYDLYHGWVVTGFSATATRNQVAHWTFAGEGETRDTYLQYQLSQFTGTSADIVSATFNFYMYQNGSNPEQYRDLAGKLFHRTDASTANGLASQQLDGNTVVNCVTVGDDLGWVSWDITNFIKADVDSGYAWSVFSFMQMGYAGLTFGSGETPEFASFLRIVTAGDPTTVPEPSTFALLGVALAGLFGLRKRFR